MRICFVASEVAPLAKTGGLADVAGALPRHLREQGHDIRVFMPFYSSIGAAALETVPVEGAQNVELRLGAHLYRYSLLATQLPGSSVPLYLVHCPAVYDRPTIYTIGHDEHLRFMVLQRAALDGCQTHRPRTTSAATSGTCSHLRPAPAVASTGCVRACATRTRSRR
jgi:starch synthase